MGPPSLPGRIKARSGKDEWCREFLGTGKSQTVLDRAWEERIAARGTNTNLRLVILQTAHCQLALQGAETSGSQEGEKVLRFVERLPHARYFVRRSTDNISFDSPHNPLAQVPT